MSQTTDRNPGPPPSSEDIAAIAERAFDGIPEALRREVAGIAILVEEFPDESVMREMELESPFDILGLYSGLSLDQKSVSDTPHDLDRIFLYRRPILDYWCETGDDLEYLVRHVLIHEIGHHFGFSDDDMEELERLAEAEEA